MTAAEPPNDFDVAIVGLGPGGIMAAHELGRSDARVLLVDQKDDVGGAAFALDVNLQNIDGFPPQSDFGQRTLGGRDRAETLVREAYAAFRGYGLPFKPADTPDLYSFPVDQHTLKRVLHAFSRDMESRANVEVRLRTSLLGVEPGTRRRWRLSLQGETEACAVETDHVVLATGKLSATWLTSFLDRMGIVYRNNPNFALGFRVEARAETINPVAGAHQNPKIRVLDAEGVVTETFCWCKNGRVMAYDFDGAKLLDGEHFYGDPQVNTSFGAITTVDLPDDTSNVLASVAFSRFMNTLGQGEVLMQRLGDFRAGRATTSADMAANSVQPSLPGYKLSNVRRYFPSVAVDGLLALLAEVNARSPGALNDDTLIYAPILERIFPDISLSHQLEANCEGMFLVGDCSGKGVGVAPAFVMGLAAAREVSSRVAARRSPGSDAAPARAGP